jgi:hypothetical protein
MLGCTARYELSSSAIEYVACQKHRFAYCQRPRQGDIQISGTLKKSIENSKSLFSVHPMPLPPPQPFVRNHRRRSTAPGDLPSARSIADVHRRERYSGSNSDSGPSPRAMYNRFVGQSIHDAHSLRQSSAPPRRWAREDLDRILTISNNITLTPGDVHGVCLREHIARLVFLDMSGPQQFDDLQFPDQNEH